MIDVEAIYAALFARLSAIPGLVTASRRLKHWSDVTPAEKPALFQTQGDLIASPKRGMPTAWTLPARVYLYVSTGGDPGGVPATILNGCIGAVIAALAPDPSSGVQDLGIEGVSHCQIAGIIETDEGTLGDEAVAIIPVEIVAV